MKIKKRIRSFSSDKVCLTLPTRWEDLSEDELRYVYKLKSKQFPALEIATYCFIRFLGIKVYEKKEAGWGCRIKAGWLRRKKFFLKTWEVQYFLKQLEFLEEPGASVMNLNRIGKYSAIDKRFHGVPFSDYLRAENFYQGYLFTQDDDLLLNLARLLYRDKKGRQPKRLKITLTERYSIIQWYYSLKNLFAGKWTDFFQRVEGASGQEGQQQMPDMAAIMNSEIRALTGGDITKEKDILAMDTWRALTELNEKAREVREMEERRP